MHKVAEERAEATTTEVLQNKDFGSLIYSPFVSSGLEI